MPWTFNARQPIYLQIVEKLTLSIIRGEYPPGSRLPSVRELALLAAVNPNTMQRALSELENRGLAESSRGAGRTVTDSEEMINKRKEELARVYAAEFMENIHRLGLDTAAAAALLEKASSKEETDGINTGM